MQHHFLVSTDGLKLHYIESGPLTAALPIICLPGLTRPAADFDKLAALLGSGQIGKARRVIQIDYRGRGLSDWDEKPENYSLIQEHVDMCQVLDHFGIARAVFFGTSRGGLQTMYTASQRPDLIAACVLNDIGPVIESEGLARIKAYVGKFPPVKTWPEIVDLLKIGMSPQFPAVTPEQYETYARLTFVEKDGHIIMRYDPALAESLKSFDMSKPIPPAWGLFDLLNSKPMLIIRGSNSDLFTRATAGEMMLRNPNAAFHEVDGQGHAPLLLDDATCERIAHFISALNE